MLLLLHYGQIREVGDRDACSAGEDIIGVEGITPNPKLHRLPEKEQKESPRGRKGKEESRIHPVDPGFGPEHLGQNGKKRERKSGREIRHHAEDPFDRIGKVLRMGAQNMGGEDGGHSGQDECGRAPVAAGEFGPQVRPAYWTSRFLRRRTAKAPVSAVRARM
jgi:hypothetical protein